MPLSRRHSSTRLLLASDLHGSNAAFIKLVRLAVKLQVHGVVIAGDFCGKAARFIRRSNNGHYISRSNSGQSEVIQAGALDQHRTHLADQGIYPILVDADWPDPEASDLLLSTAVARRLSQWLEYGLTTLGQKDIPCIAIPGNDDPPEICRVLEDNPWARNIDSRIEQFRGREFLGFGYSTPTPWHTFRELSEDDIAIRLGELASRLAEPEQAIAVIHVPPVDTGLDMAAELVRDPDGSLRETGYGETAIGSLEVRRFVERVQPLALLCGHCHTARGIKQLGRTVCVNAGSASHRGVLYAVLLAFDAEKLVSFQYLMT